MSAHDPNITQSAIITQPRSYQHSAANQDAAAAVEEFQHLAAAAERQRAESQGIVPIELAVPQVPSVLARQVLELHVAACGIPPPVDITTPEWNRMSSSNWKKRQAAEAALSDSYDELMAPLLERAAHSEGELRAEIIGASEVGSLPIYRMRCECTGSAE